VAIARIEQLYPFPVEEKAALVASYPHLAEVVWAQEEPQNMGPWRAIRHRLEENLPQGVRLRYVGRPWRASPSEGYPTAHLREQDRIVREALGSPTD
jgi:2-oxoglutarate dehydrogenase E1 component